MSDIQELEYELMHASVYDPAKAHEYYLRRRQLKGRRSGSGVDISSRSGGHGDQGGTGGSSNSVLRDSREKSLDARIETLRAKVDQLRELIRLRVDKAKDRAGVEEPEGKESSKTKEAAGKKEAASKDSAKDKPLTEKQKAEKRKASKEQYEKENKTSKAREVEALTNTIKSLRERLAKLPKPDNQAGQSLQTETKRRDGR